MTLSALARRKLLYSPLLLELIQRQSLTLMDIGARGELEEPWSLMTPGALEVIGFEPDAEECRRLNQEVPPNSQRRYIPAAVWSESTQLPVHINAAPSTSSVYPANLDLIRRYEKKHWSVREAVSIANVEAITVDAVCASQGLSPDFMKIDTQGAEYMILSGAEHVLRHEVVAVVVESWTTEVYRGQRLSGDVMSLMAANSFSLYDVNVAAAWHRSETVKGKRQVIGLDLLFVKDDLELLKASASKIIKAAAILDVYGFADAALAILREASERKVVSGSSIDVAFQHIEETGRAFFGMRERFKRRLARLLRVSRLDTPSLHY